MAAGQLTLLSDEISNLVDRVRPSVVAIRGRERFPSSGIHWQEGIIVTASHTIRRSEDIQLTFANGKIVSAALIGRDPSTDVALLKFEKGDAGDLAVAEFVEDKDLRVGQIVISAGYGSNFNINLGILSVVNGAWRTWRGGKVDRMIQADLPLYPGFSGGPLFNSAGQVIGMNTSGLFRNRGTTIPTATIVRVSEELKQKGKIPRGYLGIALYPLRLPDSLRKRSNVQDNSGLIVLNVEQDSPAEKAGLLIGDILLRLNDVPLTTIEHLQTILEPESVGQSLNATLIRAGSPMQLSLNVGERLH
jgi:S1-C subfamily serine protease